MNTYGKFAQETWKTLAPSQYALIVDPEKWFTNLGNEAETAVGDLMVQIAGADLQGETYLEKVGRLNAAKLQAEEIVRAEMLTPQAEDLIEDEDEDEEDTSPSLLEEHLKFSKEIEALRRELGEELNRMEMERDLNS